MVTTRSGVRIKRGENLADGEPSGNTWLTKRPNKTALDNRQACCAARYGAAFAGVWKRGFGAPFP
jgi:hypothetical protein